MKLIQSLIVALAMYSKIPVPHIEWTKENMRYALCFFPVVGVAVGAVTYLWYVLSAMMPVGIIFRTVVLVLIPIIISGGIHLDGLLDTADALSSWQTKERRLEILKDSHAGAFAIIVCCCYFLATFGIWTEADLKSVIVLSLGFALSRALNGFGISTFPCAKNSGLVATFSSGADRKTCRTVLLVESAICIFFMILLDWRRGVIAAATAIIVCLACRRMADKKFGGITGDIQGFFLQICELAMAYTVILAGKLW